MLTNQTRRGIRSNQTKKRAHDQEVCCNQYRVLSSRDIILAFIDSCKEVVHPVTKLRARRKQRATSHVPRNPGVAARAEAGGKRGGVLRTVSSFYLDKSAGI